MNDSTEVKKKGFLKKLKDGDFGLAKTFWIYSILIGSVLRSSLIVIIREDPSDSPKVMVMSVIVVVYFIICLIGLWKASNRYTGSKVWSVLAKVWHILATFSLTVQLIVLIETYPPASLITYPVDSVRIYSPLGPN